MKLPFTIGLGGLKSVVARLNPSGLVAKIKAKLPSKSGAKNKDDDEGFDDEADMFADLGDLDALDAAANAPDEDGDENVDYTTDAYTTDKEVDLDDLTSGGTSSAAEPDFADLDAEDAEEGASDGIDLSDLGDMPDFEDDFESEEDEAASTAAKKKKLLLIAGGGVAAAVLIGAASWLLMGSGSTESTDEAKPEVEAVDLAAIHDAVISLENIPMASADVPGSVRQEPAHATAAQPQADPVQEGLDAGPGAGTDAAPSNLSEADRSLAQLGLNVAQEPGVGVVVPSVTKASYANVPPAPPGTPLSIAPVDILVEQTDVGILPRIAEDGLTAYEAYARPEPQMDAAKPLVAIIVTGLGMSRAATEAAIAAMPQDVTLSLDMYARGLDFWVARAREDGHEVLLNLPLEAADFPFNDPGPEALRVLNAPDVNIQKLQYILSRTTGYFGVLADQGGKFLADEDQVNMMMAQLKARGLMYVDGGVQGSLGTRSAYKINVPWAAVEINLDDAEDSAALALQLDDFAQLAQKRAVAIARVSATPLTMKQLSAWLATLDQQGFQLVPVSALAKKQLIR